MWLTVSSQEDIEHEPNYTGGKEGVLTGLGRSPQKLNISAYLIANVASNFVRSSDKGGGGDLSVGVQRICNAPIVLSPPIRLSFCMSLSIPRAGIALTELYTGL